MSVKYTDAMVAELKDIGSFTHNSAIAFANKHKIPPRSVIAKIRALDLDYTPKTAKSGSTASKTPVRRKADVVAEIQDMLTLELNSMGNMTLDDLNALSERLGDLLNG